MLLYMKSENKKYLKHRHFFYSFLRLLNFIWLSLRTFLFITRLFLNKIGREKWKWKVVMMAVLNSQFPTISDGVYVCNLIDSFIHPSIQSDEWSFPLNIELREIKMAITWNWRKKVEAQGNDESLLNMLASFYLIAF